MAFAELQDALEGTNVVELTTTGRKSGRESSRPVWFVRNDDRLYLLPVTGSDSQWYKNVVAEPAIRLSAGGADYSAQATPVSDPAKVDEVVEKFRGKYGSEQVESYYPKHDVAVEVPPQA